MKTSILKIAVISLTAAVVANTPVLAQTIEGGQSQPAAEKKETTKSEKKRNSVPFRGKVTAIDKNAMTLTVGKRTFSIGSETRISKAGKPATLEDGAVGEAVSGSYKTGEDAALIATTVSFGSTSESGAKKDKQEKQK